MSDDNLFQPPDHTLYPRYTGIPTFMRVPYVQDVTQLDIAMVGVPFDSAVTNRPGARHGPREVRNQSSLIRRVHHVTGMNPYDLCKIGDAGDTPVNPVNLMKCLDLITEFYEPIAAAGVTPLSVGGDHVAFAEAILSPDLFAGRSLDADQMCNWPGAADVVKRVEVITKVNGSLPFVSHHTPAAGG